MHDLGCIAINYKTMARPTGLNPKTLQRHFEGPGVTGHSSIRTRIVFFSHEKKDKLYILRACSILIYRTKRENRT